MAQRRRIGKAVRDGGFAILGLGALALAAYFALHTPREPIIRLRMTAGRQAGERHRIAEALRAEAGRRAIVVDLRETAGSDEALGEIEVGRLDVALVQGGLDPTGRPDVRLAAGLNVEPLHLLVKEELATAVAGSLSALRGKTIGLGENGSGTARLAAEVVDFAGLDAGDFKASHAGYAELRAEADRTRLPDAVFTVSTLPSPLARHLVKAQRYRLVALPFLDAFTLGALDRGPSRVDLRHVQSATIPAFAYGVDPGVPPGPLPTLGARMLLVARKGLPAESVRRLLEVVFGSPFAQALQPTLDSRLLDLPPELPWHEGALSYIRRNAPVIAGDVVDLVEKELSILGALVTALFFLGQWARRRYLRRRDRGFQAYIVRVTEVERRAMALERAASLDLAALLGLQEELGRLKGEALDRFADGSLEGEELMSGFLSHVSDARDYLTRLILHERELIEKRARLQGRDSGLLWQEALEGTPEPGGSEVLG